MTKQRLANIVFELFLIGIILEVLAWLLGLVVLYFVGGVSLVAAFVVLFTKVVRRRDRT
jgi:hypothetical protein